MSRRDEILSVSLEYFVKNGYERTSLADIAERVGFTKPAIYYYFDNKQTLFEECCRLIIDSIEKVWSPQPGEQVTFKDALNNALGSIGTLLVNFQDLMHAEDSIALFKYFLFMYDAITRVDWFKERINNFYSTNMIHISDLMADGQDRGEIRKDLDPEVLSTAIYAMTDGLMVMQMADLVADLDSVGMEIAENIWAMVRA
jgi:AcrR family transcriptional regulator